MSNGLKNDGVTPALNDNNNGNKENGQMTPEQLKNLEKLTTLENQIRVELGNVANVESEIDKKVVEKDNHRFEIGRILGEIRDKNLYKIAKNKEDKPFSNIGEYAEERFGFKKSYVSQVETAYRVLDAVTKARTNEADYDFPSSIVAAYTLHIADGTGKKAVINTNKMVQVLEAIKKAGGVPNAKTIANEKVNLGFSNPKESGTVPPKENRFTEHMNKAKADLPKWLAICNDDEKQAKIDELEAMIAELKDSLTIKQD